MIDMKQTGVGFLVWVVALSLYAQQANVKAEIEGPVIKISSGQIRGTTVDDISVFKGIPYAAPPGG